MQQRIQKQLLVTGLVLLCLVPLKAWAVRNSAPTIQRIYTFGDSLSDPGNVFSASALVAGTGLPPPPYFEGRFTNGYLWVDYLAERLGLQLLPIAQLQDQRSAISFAYGGATSGSENVINTALPGLLQEIEQFQQFITSRGISPESLYTLWIGANDYLPQNSTERLPAAPLGDESILQNKSAQSINNIITAIRALYRLGARRFMVANLPALGTTPLAQTLGRETALLLNQATQQHNLTLDQQLEGLEQALPDLHLIRLDVEQLFEQAVEGQFAFTNVKSPCFNRTTQQVCANPDQYLFWDALHPTTAAHRIVADLAAEKLQAESNPSRRFSVSNLVIIGTLSLIALSLLRQLF
jgi:phospholipase/lecithinase/hemolysin